MSTEIPLQQIEAMRHFNRFYTKQIGVLHEGLLSSRFSLAEARVLYELAHHEQATATELGSELGVDAGYLSRILNSFEKNELLLKEPSPQDGRQNLLSLTPQGEAEFAVINRRSRAEIGELLNTLSANERQRLVDAMQTIQQILSAPTETGAPYVLRPHEPGDMGWVVQQHGQLYAREYGWNEQFEALVAGIVAHFIQNYDAQKERCWMAELDGEIVGSVFVVKASDTVAKLRMLIVHPKARGLGIGARLVDECIRFARRTGYQTLTLWTNSVLTAARHIYEKAGFELVAAEPHHSFGHDLVGETWELPL
ncbi:MAG: MarR family transcriptional regulator [Caldilineaceae bacterium]|nr:MarR family transcriptional regulator [Caldilineaceae bacterium]